MKQIFPPAPNPCGSCPYRKDVASGIWHACGGWAAVHDMRESLGLRIALSIGLVSAQDAERIATYQTSVPLFASGQEAAEHAGLRGDSEVGSEK